MITSNKNIQELIKEMGAETISADKLAEAIDLAVKLNPDAVAQYKAGKEQVFGFLVGQVQRQTQGKADPKAVADLLKQKLK